MCILLFRQQQTNKNNMFPVCLNKAKVTKHNSRRNRGENKLKIENIDFIFYMYTLVYM